MHLTKAAALTKMHLTKAAALTKVHLTRAAALMRQHPTRAHPRKRIRKRTLPMKQEFRKQQRMELTVKTVPMRVHLMSLHPQRLTAQNLILLYSARKPEIIMINLHFLQKESMKEIQILFLQQLRIQKKLQQ